MKMETMYQKLRDTAKAVLRGECTAVSAFTSKKAERDQQTTYHQELNPLLVEGKK
jgi:hypothetical protein